MSDHPRGLHLEVRVFETPNHRTVPEDQASPELPVDEVDIDGGADGTVLVYVDCQPAAADERSRIVWWLRAAADGPGRVNHSTDYLLALTDMADAIEQHPERFAEAPTGRRP